MEPPLVIIKENKILLLLFIIFTATLSLTGLQRGGVFVGLRRAEYTFMQNLVTFARIGVVPFLTAFGALGIYASFGLTPLLAFLLGIFLTSRVIPYRPFPEVKKEIIGSIFHFSSGNYAARIFEMLPTFVLPIMVANVLGVRANAYFYIAWQISMLLLAIPRFTTMSLLAECSYSSDELRGNVKRAAKFIFLLLLAAITGVFLFGRYLLLIFGREYAENSFEVLLVLVLAAMPFALNSLYVAVKRVRKEIRPVVWVYGGVAAFTLVGSYLLMQTMGLVGVGAAWLIGNGVVSLTVVKNLKST